MKNFFSKTKFYLVSLFIFLFFGITQAMALDSLSLVSTDINDNILSGTTVSNILSLNGSGSVIYNLCQTGADDSKFSITGDQLIIGEAPDYNTKKTYNICIKATDDNGPIESNFILNVIDKTLPEFNSISLSSNNIKSGSYATIGDRITFSLNLVNPDSSGTGNSITFDLLTSTGQVVNLNSDLQYTQVKTGTYAVLYGQSGSINLTNLTFVDYFGNAINGFNLPYSIQPNIIVDTQYPLVSYTDNVSGTSVTSDGINITVSDDNLDSSGLLYGFSDDASCDITDNYIYPYTSGVTFTLSNPSNNGKYLCAKATDFAGNDFFMISTNVLNILNTDITLSGTGVNENTASGYTIGSFNTIGTSSGTTFAYTLVAGTGSTDNASFTATGNILNTNFVPDFETKNSYSIRVMSLDDLGVQVEKQFTILINDINEVPTNISISSSSINENLPISSIVGSFTTTDVDAGNIFTYSLVTGTGSDDNVNFGISGNNLITNFSANYESKNNYTLRVRSSDNLGLFTEKQFFITINDVNESTSGGGSGGGGGASKDNCPGGVDYSPSNYDRTCGTKQGLGTISSTGTNNTGTGETDTGILEIDRGILETIEGITGISTETSKTDIRYIFDKSFAPVVFISRFEERFIAQKLTNGKYLLYTEKGMKLDGLFSKQYEIMKYLSEKY